MTLMILKLIFQFKDLILFQEHLEEPFASVLKYSYVILLNEFILVTLFFRVTLFVSFN